VNIKIQNDQSVSVARAIALLDTDDNELLWNRRSCAVAAAEELDSKEKHRCSWSKERLMVLIRQSVSQLINFNLLRCEVLLTGEVVLITLCVDVVVVIAFVIVGVELICVATIHGICAVCALLIGRTAKHEKDVGISRQFAALVLVRTKADAVPQMDGAIRVPKAEAPRLTRLVDE
jgi:hypothetical protein